MALLIVTIGWVVTVVLSVVVVRRLIGREAGRRRDLWAALVDSSSGAALVFDGSRSVVVANSSASGLAGREPRGRKVVDVLGVADDPVASRVVDAAIDEVLAGSSASAELSGDGDEGRMRILELSGRPLGDGHGFVQIVDATERRERAMRSAQSERLESLGALAGGLAHDFNNLLFVTLGNLQLMAMNDLVVGDEKLSKFVSRSMSAVERGAEITKSLLAVARSQPLEESAVSVTELVRGVLPLVRQALGGGRVVETNLPDDSVQLMVDAGRLSSCLLNLAFNARDAMGPTGRLTIEARPVAANDVGPDLPAGERYLALSITDDGCGMPEEVVARAFEPFFTTKRPGSGTGLGLATVYAFARQSGGTATLTSRPGVGTTVTMVLPIHDASSAGTADAPRRRAGRRVVVADDEQALAEMVTSWLIDVGIDARFATSPKTALELVEEFRPDVLVSDANFGEETDGVQLAQLATALDPDLAVVFMTGYSASMRALQELGERTLAKPFSRELLYATLDPYLAESRER